MAKLKITQRRSTIKKSKYQKRTMASLGLRRINHSVVHQDGPVLQGMLRKVSHLVEVQPHQEQ
jgi:large subunit ribosomal protein L30